jgi:hypothetical protein
MSAHWAPEVQIFWPLTRKWSPLSSARVWNAAVDDVGDVLLLLGLGAVLQQGRAEHADAHADDGVHGADGRHLLLQGAGLVAGQAAAAVLGRPGRDAPTLGAHALLPEGEIAFRRLGRHDHRLERGEILAEGGGEIRLKPVAGFSPEAVESTVAKIGHQKYSIKFNILYLIIPCRCGFASRLFRIGQAQDTLGDHV